jgi:2-keto-4-pentenoate hydratase/2-oxohepta-3-ene-1,7-dioic acid hydratase in catechol pathway
MRLVAFTHRGRSGVGVLAGEGVIDTGIDDMHDVIADRDAATTAITAAARRGQPFQPDRLSPPVPRPTKMLFCGTNYEDHLAEVPDLPRPQTPFFFAKLPSSLIGPRDPVLVPDVPGLMLDYEAELAVIIGAPAHRVSEADALSRVFGYTAVNDITARNIQFTDQQITLGKGIDTFCPMGPCVTLTDELDDPSDLRVTCTVNGEKRQDSTTANLIATVPALISFLSQTITLMPGDVIATGTPAGVGYFRDPPLSLAAGDIVEVTVEGVGTLTNTIQTYPGGHP